MCFQKRRLLSIAATEKAIWECQLGYLFTVGAQVYTLFIPSGSRRRYAYFSSKSWTYFQFNLWVIIQRKSYSYDRWSQNGAVPDILAASWCHRLLQEWVVQVTVVGLVVKLWVNFSIIFLRKVFSGGLKLRAHYFMLCFSVLISNSIKYKIISRTLLRLKKILQKQPFIKMY